VECDILDPLIYAHMVDERKVNRTMLGKRHRGVTISREEAATTYHQYLSIAQEQALIDWINQLSNQGLHITSSVFVNTVEELL
jgi:hypothetical protein